MIPLFQRGSGSSHGYCIASLAIAAVLALSAMVGCSDDTTAPAAAVSGSFVGLAQGVTVPTVVTVEAGQPDASGARTVTVYACDSKELGTIIWFVGQVSGNNFTLASSNGEATVTGQISANGVTGTVQDSAVTFTFSLRKTAPGEGIHTVTVAANGDLHGVSLDGRTRLEGHYDSLGTIGSSVTVTIVHPDSTRQTFTEPSRAATGEGTFRANMIFDGSHLSVRGSSFATTTKRSQLIGSSRIIGLNGD